MTLNAPLQYPEPKGSLNELLPAKTDDTVNNIRKPNVTDNNFLLFII